MIHEQLGLNPWKPSVIRALKSVAHNVFSLGVAVYVTCASQVYLPASLFLAVWLAITVNFMIDALGHSRRSDRPVRSWITHSVLTAPVWGGSIGFLTSCIVFALLQSVPSDEVLAFSVGLGVLLSYSHLLLDSLTEGGIFLGRGRMAITHFRNGNLLLNALFSVLGILLALAGLGQLQPIPF